jgi:DNA modification methylase
MNEIKHGDCLDYLATLPDNSVDMVLTDPPYSIGFDGGKGWDKQWKTEEEYLSWCNLWTAECLRVLKPNRMMIVWGTLKTETSLKYKLRTSAYLKDAYDGVPQNEIIWGYNWGGRTKSNFARKHEYAWCWSKGKDFLFNADNVRVERKVKKNMNLEKKLMKAYVDSFEVEPSRAERMKYKKEHIDPQTLFQKGTIPTSIWIKNNHTTSKDYIGWHPTTKNIDILSRMILAYTNEGDVVLDVFMGSAATAVAALRTGRKYLGCESDKEYLDKSKERIEDIEKEIENAQSISSVL